MKINRLFIAILLCLSGYAGVQSANAAVSYADYYYVFLNTSTTNNQLITNVTEITSSTSDYGTFTRSGSILYYQTKTGQNRAGIDSCIVTTSLGIQKVAVAVCAIRPTAVGYEQHDGDDNIFDMNNALVPMENLPDNWTMSYDFYDYNGLTQVPLPPGISLSTHYPDYVQASAKLYVDNEQKAQGVGSTKDFLTFRIFTTGQVRNISTANRHYAIIEKEDRGFQANVSLVYQITSGTDIIHLIDNYSNSAKYGEFYLADNNKSLYYRSDYNYPEYGMDMQAFTLAAVDATPAGATKLAYGVTVGPVDKSVAKDGWAVLEARDIIKGMPRNYSVKYTYWEPVSNSNPPQFGTQISNIPGEDLRGIVYDIPLSSPYGGLKPGDPGYPGGTATYATQTYLMRAELYQNFGPSASTRMAVSGPLPIACIETIPPAWLTKENYDNGLVEFRFECPDFSVCPEKAASNLNQTKYAVYIDIEVSTVAYKMIDGGNGEMVRDYSVAGFDITSFAKYTGYYNEAGTLPLLTSSAGDDYPYHRYLVGSERGVNFPHNGADGVYTQQSSTDASYGTKTGDAMALFVKTTIDPETLWGISATPIVIPANEGKVTIRKGICGETNNSITCPEGNSSLLYRQDFSGYYESDPVVYDSTKVSSGRNFLNAQEAMKGSTYVYKNFEREKTSNAQYPNEGLPFLEEGEYVIIKKTEQHLNTNVASYPLWRRFDPDHTNAGNPNIGYMMLVNAGVEKGTFFDYEIKDLCMGATLTFSAWIKNVVTYSLATDPVEQTFEIYDLETGKLISRYITGPILNPANTGGSSAGFNDWKQYGFQFSLPTMTTHIRLKILNSGRGSNGNDFAIDDIEVRLCNNTQTNMMDPPAPVPCVEEQIEVEVTLVDNDKKYYAWLYSSTGQVNMGDPWLQLATGEINDIDLSEPVITLRLNPYSISVDNNEYFGYPTGYYRFALGYSPDFLNGNCYIITEPVHYNATNIGDAYLWTGANGNGNWNEGGNWKRYYPDDDREPEDTQGPADFPNHCNDVYVPGKNISHYPLIQDGDECRNIYFYYGARVGAPQKLQYVRAFMDYNFGKVSITNPNVPQYGSDVQENYAATPLNRGQWYTIASPFKRTLTGDFGYAGKPHTWQMKFEALKDADDNISYGQWSGTYNDADIELGATYNAMALLVGEYVNNYPGLNNHENIESVDGIIQLPYYFDTQSRYYKSHLLHEYDLYSDTSTFYRYNMYSLEPIYTNPGKFRREIEFGARFIFEDSDSIPIDTYTYKVPAGKDVLIGNPFPSRLDMEEFFRVNADQLTSPVYYDFVGDYTSEALQSFRYYVQGGGSVPGINIPNTAPRYVEPLKSFVISTSNVNAVNDSVTIQLTYEQATATNPGPVPAPDRYSARESEYADLLLLSVEGTSGSSLLTLSFEEKDAGNAGLLRMKDSKIPSIYAIDPEKGNSNMVQFEKGYKRNIIPLGVLAFNQDEQLTIKAYNTQNLKVEQLYLVDTKLEKEINLLQTDEYTYPNINGIYNRFELHVVPSVPTDISDNPSSQVIITSYNSSVHITSTTGNPVNSVEIVDLMGRTILKEMGINKALADYQLPEQYNVVIVKVVTADNMPTVQKIVLK